MGRTFNVVIEKNPGGGFVATVAELPGCMTQADSLEALRGSVRDVIARYLDDVDPNEPLPEFVGVEQVEV